MKNLILLIVLIVPLFMACEPGDENYNQIDIKGYWVSTSNELDTLLVKQDSLFRRDLSITFPHYIQHKYTYTLEKDSIFILYEGPLKPLIPPSIVNFNFDEQNQILTIDMDEVYPGYSGTKFKFLRGLQ